MGQTQVRLHKGIQSVHDHVASQPLNAPCNRRWFTTCPLAKPNKPPDDLRPPSVPSNGGSFVLVNDRNPDICATAQGSEVLTAGL